MKKLICCAIIAAVLLSAVIFEQIYLNNSFDTLISKIDALDQQIVAANTINTTKINQSVQDIQNYWQQVEQILCMTINYNDLQRLGEQFKRVKSYVRQDQKEDCLAELEVLAYYAQNYKDIFILRFSNIF